MIGNFRINNDNYLTNSNFKTLKLNPTVKEWNQSPVSNIFRANVENIKHLHRFGDVYSFEIEVLNLTEDQINTYFMPLNGVDSSFEMDIGLAKIPVKVIVEPFKYKNRNLFDSVRISMKSNPLYDTESGKLAQAPILNNVGVVKTARVVVDNGVQKILRYGRG